MRENYIISHHNRKTHVNVHWPEKTNQVPMIIFAHGYNGCMEHFEETAKYFSKQGYAFLRISFCGGSTRDTSGYPSTQMSVITETEDLEAVFDEICSWKRVDTNNIFLFGASMGGLVSALLAAKLKDKIKGLILLYPALCVADDWRMKYPTLDNLPETLDFWKLKLGRKFIEDIHTQDPFEIIGGFEENVCIMHGTSDAIVPYSYSEHALKTYQRASLHAFVDEGHGFSDAGTRRMEAMALYFVEECIGKDTSN